MREKLLAFLGGDVSGASLCRRGEERALSTLEELPRASTGYVHPEYWFLHGGPRGAGPASPRPRHRLYEPISFDGIDELFRWYADHFVWALVPWGGTSSYLSLAFLTRDPKRMERFLRCSDNRFPVYGGLHGSLRNARLHDMLIASRAVESRIEEVVEAVVFYEDGERAGARVWEACMDSGPPPKVVFPELGDDDWVRESWGEAEYSVTGSLGPFAEDCRLSVYEPRDRKSFLAMCQSYRHDLPTLIAVPNASPTESIASLLEKTEDEYAYSDLSYVKDCVAFGAWFYGLGRGHSDEAYSLFASRDNALVRAVVGSGPEGSARLVACF